MLLCGGGNMVMCVVHGVCRCGGLVACSGHASFVYVIVGGSYKVWGSAVPVGGLCARCVSLAPHSPVSIF